MNVTLLERYAALGGLASGGMVLVLDDMVNGEEISVTGIVSEYVERLEKLGLGVYPPEQDRYASVETWNRWGRWGAFDFHQHTNPKPTCYAVAFDPDGWKRVSNDLVRESGVELRLHSWFSRPVMDGNRLAGVLCETKQGPQAVLGDVVVDTTGDIDVASRAGASYVRDQYLTTLVFRPGVVWCNRPHMTGFDGTDPESLTAAEFDVRQKIGAAVEYVKQHLPGFERCYIVDVAEQIGVRQTRLLQGEYVVTKDDITGRRHFPDSVARGRDYDTPAAPRARTSCAGWSRTPTSSSATSAPA